MRLVIKGAGLAGKYAALFSARRRDIKGVSPEELEIAPVAPEPAFVVHPRLYGAKPETLTASFLELLGLPTSPYHHEAYAICLDRGAAGAMFTRGRDRKGELVGAEGKKTKPKINTVWTYPPPAERATALASAANENVTKL